MRSIFYDKVNLSVYCYWIVLVAESSQEHTYTWYKSYLKLTIFSLLWLNQSGLWTTAAFLGNTPQHRKTSYQSMWSITHYGLCSFPTLLDLSSPFNTADHEILINPLKCCCVGIKDTALTCFHSSSSDRPFSVVMEEFSSCSAPSGVGSWSYFILRLYTSIGSIKYSVLVNS